MSVVDWKGGESDQEHLEKRMNFHVLMSASQTQS